MGPNEYAAMAKTGGDLLALPFDIYGGIQSMKLDRRKVREQERDGKFGRLQKIISMANGLNSDAAERAMSLARRNGPRAQYNGQGMLPRG